MKIYELFDEITDNYDFIPADSFPRVEEEEENRIKEFAHKKLGLGKKKKRLGKALLALAAAVILTGGIIIGTVIVTGQSDPDHFRSNGYGEYLSIYREYCQKFADEGIPVIDESSPYSDMLRNSDPIRLAQEMAKQDMINTIYDAAKPFSEAISDNDPNSYFSDREAYYEFITECCRLYKGNDLSEEDKGRILWLIIQDYYNVDGSQRTLRGDQYHMGYKAPKDLDSIKTQRDAALEAVEDIVSGLREKNLIPAEETAPEMEGETEYNARLKEKWDKYNKELESLVKRGETEYKGIKGIYSDNCSQYARQLAEQEMRLETLGIVKEHTGAEDIDEAVVETPLPDAPEKWIKHCEYLQKCGELFYSGEVSDYEKLCLMKAMGDIVNNPEKLSDKEADKILQKTRILAKQICEECYMNYLNKYNEWLAAQDPATIEQRFQ